MAELKPYPTMKDSGVEWLGMVPEHWEVHRADRKLRISKKLVHPDEISNQQVIHYSIPNVQQFGRGVIEKGAHVDSAKIIIDRAVVLVSKLNPRKCTVTYAEPDAELLTIASIEFVALEPRECDGHFIKYLYSSEYVRLELSARVNSATKSHQRCTPEDISKLQISIPPLPEQVAIARYLDYVDSRVRRLTEAKRKLIGLLTEQKQAIIQRAVTRGLDPNVPLKDSGIEWLGMVPQHWETAQVKRHYSIQLGKMLQNRPAADNDFETQYLKAQHVQWFSVRTADAPKMWASHRDIEQFGVSSGDLLVCEGGEGGRSGMVYDIPPGYIIQNALHRVRPLSTCLNEYLLYVMNTISSTGWFTAINNKATIAHFTCEKFGALKMPIPPLPEQVAIVEYLDRVTAKIDIAVAGAERQIELLNEYRTRLIADVVTGKLDVRDATPPRPPQS